LGRSLTATFLLRFLGKSAHVCYTAWNAVHALDQCFPFSPEVPKSIAAVPS
jgi:hypothetical protein